MAAVQTPDEIYEQVVAILHSAFDVDPATISPSTRLFDDLDIDSIDAVDLIVRLKPLVGGNLSPEAFRSVRTIQDVVDALAAVAKQN
ncbi:MAG: acyl carrier protein [Lysobacteraceae bacterium]|nr:MAG: acyl carrier protein [Xanthomonadaceae bacterium]